MTSNELAQLRTAIGTKDLLDKHKLFAAHYRNLKLALHEIALCGESSLRIIDKRWEANLLSLCITNYSGKLKLHKSYKAVYEYLDIQKFEDAY